jgi:hypothetical protein
MRKSCYVPGIKAEDIDGQRANLSGVFAGQNIGIKETSEKIWLVTFMQFDLG